MAIHLVTLGGLNVTSDSGELHGLLGQHTRAALFVYLAVERRVSRESVIASFWPESDTENARHALRQSLYQLRKAVGAEWIESRAHELVVTGDVRTDVHDFANAIERGDLASAVDLYRGPFLDGVHLADLTSWESWVDARRAHYARAFRKACRDLLDARRAAGDLTGAIRIAERWTARDPSDDEAQHRLIETLAAAGERAEAIRQYEAYARMLEPDGLQPLDETVALVERLRSDSPPLPALKAIDRPAPTKEIERRLESPAVRPRRRWVLAAAALAIVALGITWSWRRRQADARPPSDPATIAVLPFTVHGAPNVAYLGPGMVNLLGAALDGAGSLRPIDTRAVFAATGDSATALTDRDHGARVAERLGAGQYVVGDVVESGGRLQIEAAVYGTTSACGQGVRQPREMSACRSTRPTATGVVSGAADSVFALVDKLAARLLGGLGDPAADRLRRIASITTASLPAFKSYLDGEELMRTGQFERAADSYLTAIALDSTFAVAHYRLALAREWAPLPGEDSAASAAARFGARLSTRDHQLLEAFREWRAGNATGAERAYRALLARYPDDVDAWSQLGEILFHHGPLVGQPVGESEQAWRKVLSYEPRNLFAIAHLARIAVVAGRVAALDSLLAPFTPNELQSDRRLSEVLLLRALARADTASARSLAQDLGREEPLAVWRTAAFLAAFSSAPERMASLMPQLTADDPDPSRRADLQWFESLLHLSSGQRVATGAALDKAINSEREVPAERLRWGFEDVTEWFAATLPLPFADSTLLRVRDQAATEPRVAESRPPFETEMGMGAPIQLQSLRQYTLGVLSLRLHDVRSAGVAATKLERLAGSPTATVLTRDLDRGLRARLAWQRGRLREALGLLDSLEARDSQGDIAVIPFVSRASERFLHGAVLESLGRNDEALAWFASLGSGSVTEIPLRAPAELRQAEIYERLGKRAEAAKHYARARALWKDADPEFRRLVSR